MSELKEISYKFKEVSSYQTLVFSEECRRRKVETSSFLIQSKEN
jgi:hypothetical protein